MVNCSHHPWYNIVVCMKIGAIPVQTTSGSVLDLDGGPNGVEVRSLVT